MMASQRSIAPDEKQAALMTRTTWRRHLGLTTVARPPPGAKTLHIRARQASANARAIACGLEREPRVSAVNDRGFESHANTRWPCASSAGTEWAAACCRSASAVGRLRELCCRRRASSPSRESWRSRAWSRCESMTHEALPVEQRVAAGVFTDLVRVSCGI